jgi:hypothetical protein
VLVVRAESPVWATQLRYLTAQLIERADMALGLGSVREVRITVGPLEGQRTARGSADTGRAAAPAAVRHTEQTDLSGTSVSGGSSTDPQQGPDDHSSPEPEASR